MPRAKTKTPSPAPPAPPVAAEPAAPTPPTKLDQLIAQLRSPQGATVPDLVDLTGWQEHTVRGCMAGTLKKKRGLNLVSEKTEAGRVYRIVEPKR